MGTPVPIQRELHEIFREVSDAMPIQGCPQAEAYFMARMANQWWALRDKFSHKTVAEDDVAELKRLHAKYCGEPQPDDPAVGPASE